MDTAWTSDGQVAAAAAPEQDTREVENAVAGPSRMTKRRRIKASKPFVSARYKPDSYDGVFRVVLITSGSVASVKLPLIVGALCKNHNIDVQVVATQASRHFYTQAQVDEEVRAAAPTSVEDVEDAGVRIWVDDDEWSDWGKLGDPILHIELRRWADLVVVAPCSADFLAKLASGLCDNLPLSLLRALPSTTPVILCPAMNTHMYTHPFTSEHLIKLQDTLGYLISGPQGAGLLACGDEGPGKMTDWRDIADMIESFAKVFHLRHTGTSDSSISDPPSIPKALNPRVPHTSSDQGVKRDKLDGSLEGYSGDLSVNVVEEDPFQSGAGNSAPLGWEHIWRRVNN